MAKKPQDLTSSEFSSQTGLPVSTVTKLIRAGKIKAEKKAGKWMIHSSQLKNKVVQEASIGQKSSAQKKAAPKTPKKTSTSAPKASHQEMTTPRPAGKTYSISEFAEMTYLTEFGVTNWLKKGLLKGQQAENGDWYIEADNLQVPNVKRLLREEYLK